MSAPGLLYRSDPDTQDSLVLVAFKGFMRLNGYPPGARDLEEYIRGCGMPVSSDLLRFSLSRLVDAGKLIDRRDVERSDRRGALVRPYRLVE